MKRLFLVIGDAADAARAKELLRIDAEFVNVSDMDDSTGVDHLRSLMANMNRLLSYEETEVFLGLRPSDFHLLTTGIRLDYVPDLEIVLIRDSNKLRGRSNIYPEVATHFAARFRGEISGIIPKIATVFIQRLLPE